jgi:hypothetical protein
MNIPVQVWLLVRDLNTVSPEARKRVIGAWRAALEIART